MNASIPANHPPEASPLFETVAGAGSAFNEAFTPLGQPREHWRPVLAAFGAIAPEALRQRQERVKRMRHEDGATYNPFDSPDGKGTPWALDMIPLPLTPVEWSGLEAALIQRAGLMERILADVYGPQHLLTNGLLPPELFLANPNFLHGCHGITPHGNRYLHYYAVDLYRGADGRFRVLRDHASHPAGLGYALENRIVISRMFPDLYHRTQIRRLAPFFRTLHDSLAQRAGQRKPDPAIMLLSPGPDSPIYFEHALLSRYLGYPLVEGQDLTVRSGRVYLKKLGGLEPVDAIFRHISDGESDPFALRRDTSAGVAGLLQVAREQQVDITNPLGSGFLDTPVLPVFLPGICRQLLGEELMLAEHPSWWCGESAGRQYVLDHFDSLRHDPALDWAAGSMAADPTAAIQVAPYLCMAREPVLAASAPAWGRQGVQAAQVLLRLFACATEQGFAVMPGGLAITAPDTDSLLGCVPERQQSKDIWVLSDRPVEAFSLMDSLHTAAEFSRSSDLPSRVADHLLWLGRYLERAEGLVRLLRSLYRRLAGEARLEDIPELPFLLTLLRAVNTVPELLDDDQEPLHFRTLSKGLHQVLYREDRPESVIAILKRVQNAARNVRDRLSPDSWRVINRFDEFADSLQSDPLEQLDHTLFTLNAFSGLAMESMTRGLGWRFMDLGRRIERGLHQAALIRAGLPRVCVSGQNALEALLEVSDSIMTYRARYRTAFQLAPALDLLLVDEGNPKSLAFQLSQIASHVEHLPRQIERRFASPEERMALEMLTATRLLDLSELHCGLNNIDDGHPLLTYLDAMDGLLTAFCQQISAHYLTRVTATPHFSQRFDAPEP